jgi:hypothetical protein
MPLNNRGLTSTAPTHQRSSLAAVGRYSPVYHLTQTRSSGWCFGEAPKRGTNTVSRVHGHTLPSLWGSTRSPPTYVYFERTADMPGPASYQPMLMRHGGRSQMTSNISSADALLDRLRTSDARAGTATARMRPRGQW